MNNLISLWNTIWALDFDLVVDPDTLSRMMPQIHQIALVKPHLVPACNHLKQRRSPQFKALRLLTCQSETGSHKATYSRVASSL
ncbi:hypothetical protein L3X38_025914 [Prunus dulcis]|uniref:Uncharacterized protein n=1 Tax=Prunus dulcis TaxID=3755 RepID=A0AAD4W2M2_PRUDU|nr:hypothetical protein L3X38_025914 [Prunus dulcis]